ncbi:MAG: caspase family protein [Ignavibacteriales bacterium]|nr:caspase family protein [Ignavibacteriales bacterium]
MTTFYQKIINYFIVVFFLCSIPFTLFAQDEDPNYLFSDNFYDNSNNWFIQDDATAFIQVEEGQYILEYLLEEKSWLSWRDLPAINKDFSIEAKIEHISGVENYGYGLVWGLKDANNTYAFNISADGYYQVGKWDDGSWSNILEWTSSNDIRQGNYASNVLRIQRRGSNYEFYVNDIYLTSLSGLPFFGNKFGFNVNRHQRIAIDFVKVKNIDDVSFDEFLDDESNEITLDEETSSIVFFDAFENNYKSWTTQNDNERYIQVENGYYNFELKENGHSWATWQYVSIFESDDFSIESAMRHSDGIRNNQFGIAFGLKDNHNYFTFCISDNGFYTFRKIVNNSWVSIIDWTQSDYIYTNNVTNILGIRKKGSQLEFIINDKSVNTASVESFFGNNIGFTVSNAQRIEFDYLTVKKLQTADVKYDYSSSEKKPPVKKTEEVRDVSPPSITITEPLVSRGMKVVQKEKSTIIRGKATDESGVYEVFVNGIEATISSGNEFWAEVKLAVGENKIRVQATDVKNNSAEEEFTIVRESGQQPQPLVSEKKSSPGSQLGGKYYALVIAIQDYTDPSINDLDFPIKDSERLKNTLTEFYTFDENDVTFLKNPDRKQIIQTLSSFRGKLTVEDNLLIFYAGHGYWDEDLQQGYWLPSNSTSKDPSEWLPNSTIRDYIRGIKTKHTLLLADACFSGGIFKGRDAFLNADISVQETYKVPSRRAMTSGSLKTVPDKSVFVEYMIKRLKDNSDKFLFAQKLFVSLKEAVTNNSPNRQTPMYGIIQETGDEGVGDFIFVRK